MARKSPPQGTQTVEQTLSQQERQSEKVIAALRFLVDESREASVPEFLVIVEDAFEKCVKLYVEQQRARVVAEADPPADDGEKKLN